MAWLAVLLAVLVIAHLWAHAHAPESESFTAAEPIACLHGADHDHHTDHAHGGTFLLPGAKPVTVEPMSLRAVLPYEPLMPTPELDESPLEHVPKRGHRDRAVSNHTLEVYRP
jgi:hypothetical protein